MSSDVSLHKESQAMLGYRARGSLCSERTEMIEEVELEALILRGLSYAKLRGFPR